MPVLRTFDNGFGIMQLTSGYPTKNQLRNWIQNATEGVVRLVQLAADAQTYNNQVRQGSSWNYQTGGNPPNEGVAYPNAPNFTGEQLDLEIWARYNSYHNYDSVQGIWDRRPSNSSGLTYADDLARRRNSILNNNQYPPGWGGN